MPTRPIGVWGGFAAGSVGATGWGADGGASGSGGTPVGSGAMGTGTRARWCSCRYPRTCRRRSRSITVHRSSQRSLHTPLRNAGIGFTCAFAQCIPAPFIPMCCHSHSEHRRRSDDQRERAAVAPVAPVPVDCRFAGKLVSIDLLSPVCWHSRPSHSRLATPRPGTADTAPSVAEQYVTSKMTQKLFFYR